MKQVRMGKGGKKVDVPRSACGAKAQKGAQGKKRERNSNEISKKKEKKEHVEAGV